jgi:hypothetical protein
MAQIQLSGSVGVPGSAPILGSYNVVFSTNAPHTMSAAEYSNYFLDVTGTLSSPQNLIAPLTQGQSFIVQNNTTGGQSITIIGSSGTGITITNGQTLTVVCDGTNYLTTSGTSFTAGGDLSGSNTDQTVIAIQGNSVYAETLGSSEDGYALIWNADGYWLATPISSGTTVTGTGLWYNSSGVLNSAAITLTGDVSEGALSSGHVPLTVIGLDGTPIVITTLTTGNGLSYNGTDWVNSALNLAGGSAYVTGALPVTNLAHGTSAQVLMSNGTPATTWTTISGDVSITATGATTVTALQNNAVASGTLTSAQDGYVLSWNGTNWSAVPASSTVVVGQNYSFSNTSSDISTYDQLLDNATGSQNTLTAASSSSSKVLIKAFATPVANPNVDFIDAGLWVFNFYAYASLTGAFTTVLIFDVYTRTSGGSETLLFSATSQNIQVTSAQLYTLMYNYQSGTAIPNTDRIVIKVSAQSSNAVSTTVSFVFDGTTMASLVQTPITGSALQLGGDVTGTTSANTVVAIQGNTVTSGALVEGDLLIASSTSNWATTAVTGDVSFSAVTPGLTTVLNIHGASVPIAGSLTTGNTLYVSGSSALSYGALNLAGGAGYVTGNLPVGNIAPGTSAQVLMSNGTPATTWTTISGDATVSATGAITNVSARGGDILFNSGGASIEFISTVTNPSLFQQTISTASATGNSLTIQAQNATGTNSTGGALFLTSGTGTALDGYVWLQCGGVNVLELEAAAGTDDGYVSSGQVVRFSGQESVFASNTTAPIYALSNTITTTDGYTHDVISFSPPTNTNSRWSVSAIARDQSNSNDFGVDLAIFQVRNVAGVLALNPTSPAMVNMIPSSGQGSCALGVIIVGTQVIIQVTGEGAGETMDWNVIAQAVSVM